MSACEAHEAKLVELTTSTDYLLTERGRVTPRAPCGISRRDGARRTAHVKGGPMTEQHTTDTMLRIARGEKIDTLPKLISALLLKVGVVYVSCDGELRLTRNGEDELERRLQ